MTIRYIVLASFVICGMMSGVPPLNLFRPSDRFLMPEPLIDCWSSQFSIGYEGAFHARGFRDEGDDCLQADIDASTTIRKKTNVLQIYQCNQNALAALKGFDSAMQAGQLSQLFNIDDENGRQGLLRPKGCLRVPLNLLLSQRFYFNHGLSFELHLPILHMELKDVRWRPLHSSTTGEQRLEKDFVRHIRRIAGLDLCGWKRTGVGDLVAQMTWMQDFPQYKPAITNVRVQTRFGVNFPTGKVRDEDKVLAVPFGNDGAWGIQFAGGLDLTFCWTLRAGIDAEFLYLFPHTRCRRVQTACNQTDLLFLTKVSALREFGLGQQLNLYLESCHVWRGLSMKLNYQLLKRNEDRIDIGSDRLDPAMVNSSESLQDWTAHSLIVSARYDLWKDLPYESVLPSFIAWFKWGFNGKRAILTHTLGLQASVTF